MMSMMTILEISIMTVTLEKGCTLRIQLAAMSTKPGRYGPRFKNIASNPCLELSSTQADRTSGP